MLFSYEAFTKDGETVFGTIEVDKKTDVAELLYDQGLIVSKVIPVASQKKLKVKPEELIIFTRLLSTAVNASIPLTRALEITMEELPMTSSLRIIILSVLHQIKVGKNLSDAFSLYHNVFSEFYISMIRAGEKTGKLGRAMEEILKYLQKRYEMKKKISSAMLYPVMIFSFAILILVFFIVFIIPRFQDSYTSFGKELPGLTKGMLDVTNWIKGNFLILLGGITAIVITISRLIKTEKGKTAYEKVLFNIPVAGQLYRKDIISRFTRTLSVLLFNGITLIEALELIRGVVNNSIFERTILESIADLTRGESFSKALKTNEYMPTIMIQMASMGEESGKLADLMGSLSDFYEKEVDVAVESITSIITPIMILFIGIIIGTIIIALFLPIFSMSDMVQ